MLRIVATGLTAFFITASPLAYAQARSAEIHITAADLAQLTDMRVNMVKAALHEWPNCARAILSTFCATVIL